MVTEKHGRHFTEDGFWKKVTRLPGKASCGLLRTAITLYVLLESPDVPILAKGTIVAVLGYFIWPLDALPDFLPGGYIDDLAAMTLALANLKVFTNDDIRERVIKLLPKECRTLGIPILKEG